MSCKNCGNTLLENQNFCSQCGAKIIKQRLSTFALLKEWSETIFNIDNKFIATFRHLFSSPARVMVGYVQGVRNKYMTPINYLLLSVGVFGFYLLATKSSGYFHEEIISGIFAGINDHEDIDPDKKELLKLLSFPLLLFQIPIYALAAKWVYGKSYNFAEHIVISSYWVSHLIFITMIISGIFYWIDVVGEGETIILTIGITFIFTFYIHRIIYKQSIFKQFFKFLAFIFLALFLLLTYLITGGYLILG